jgi:hypothetical protein
MSRSENFYSEYSQIRRDKRVVLIPEKVLMEEMLAYLTDGDMEHYKQRSANMYSNWKKRYYFLN